MATPAYPIVRKIRPADLKDALAKGVDDFWAMPTSLVFLGLIYPIVGMCLAGFALPLLFPLMAGFALVGPFAAIGLYEISRRRELGLETSWAHAFDLCHSPSIPSLLALGLLRDRGGASRSNGLHAHCSDGGPRQARRWAWE